MCSSIRREFGWPETGANPSQPGRLAVVPALEQIVEAAAMRVRQWFGQGCNAPVSTGDRLGTRPLDGVEGGQNDRLLPPRVPDQGAGQLMPLSVYIASSVSIWTACR